MCRYIECTYRFLLVEATYLPDIPNFKDGQKYGYITVSLVLTMLSSAQPAFLKAAYEIVGTGILTGTECPHVHRRMPSAGWVQR